MKVVVPMAGLGTRFKEVSGKNPEYNRPKPFIRIRNIPMVCWATGSLPFPVAMPDLTFVILAEHDRDFGIADGLREIYSKEVNIIKLNKVTRGAAETAYAARGFIDPDDELIVSDSDHFFDGSFLAESIKNKDADTVGVIPVFLPPDDGIARWSYSLIKKRNYIEAVGEKDVELMKQGAKANIGAYYFSQGRYFLQEVEEVIRKNDLTGSEGKKEFYVAPIYDRLIRKGLKVQAAFIPQVWGLGTPQDLEVFLNTCSVSEPLSLRRV